MGTDKRSRQKANREIARQARIRRQKMQKVRKRGLIFGVGIPVLIVALFGVSNFTGSSNSNSASDTTELAGPPTLETLPGRQITGATPCPKTDGTEERATIFEKAPSMCIDAKKSYTATFDTTEGEIVVALDTKNTPNTVNNFVTLSNYGYYNKSYIFRTDPSIDIIQGGGASNIDDPGYTIKDEGTGFKYSAGDLVMARSSGENSGGGQFFFVTGPKASVLDSQGTYVTFGKVTSGLDITQKILALNSGEGDLGGAPSRAVEIRSISITAK